MHQHDADCAHGSAPAGPGPALGLAPGQPVYPGLPPHVQPAPESRAYRFLMALWTKPAWLAPLAILGCVAAAFTYVLANDPTDARRDPLGPCAFKAMTGWDCPGCGGTRMVWYLLHADLPAAFQHHLIALVAVPVVAYLYVVWAAKRIFRVSLPSRGIPASVWGTYLVVWLAFSVLRNLPYPPFEYFFVA